MSWCIVYDVQVSATILLRRGGFKKQPDVVGGVIIYVCVIVVQGETMWPRTTIIGIEDSEVDCLFTHLAFGVGVPCCYLAQTPSIRGSFEQYVLTNHLLSSVRGQEVQAWCHLMARTLVGNQVEVK